ncbi:MAG: hypothetical protein QM744_18135 [Mesorhizobium sp.]
MADKKAVKAAIDQHATVLKQKPGVVGLGVSGTAANAKMAVYVSSSEASREIPDQVTVRQGGKTGKVEIEVVEVGSLKPGT